MSIFKEYDIREIYGKDLTERDAYLLGFYLSKYLDFDEIKIAHDLRLSHESLTKFLMQGILDAGKKVIYLGSSSTPNFYFSLFNDCSTGIMVSAFNLPKEYNGFRIINELNSFDSRNGLNEVKKLVEEDLENKKSDFDLIKDSLISTTFPELFEEYDVEEESNLNDYIMFLKNFYDMTLSEIEREVLESKTFGFDFSSGVSSMSVASFLSLTKLDCNFYNEKPNGNFPIHDPDSLNAQTFIKENLESNFFTVAFDGDGGKIVFFDLNGNKIEQDCIIAKFIEFFGNKFKKFVCDFKISKSVQDFAKSENLYLDLIDMHWPFYKEYLDKNHCVFGAELSGYMFFRDFHNFDNSDIVLIYMLKFVAMNLLKDENISFNKIFDEHNNH